MCEVQILLYKLMVALIAVSGYLVYSSVPGQALLLHVMEEPKCSVYFLCSSTKRSCGHHPD